jgi:hypothetical protein
MCRMSEKITETALSLTRKKAIGTADRLFSTGSGGHARSSA